MIIGGFGYILQRLSQYVEGFDAYLHMNAQTLPGGYSTQGKRETRQTNLFKTKQLILRNRDKI